MPDLAPSRSVGWTGWLAAALLALCGLGFVLPGAYLLMLGGSPYYAVAGVALLACAGLQVRGSPWTGRLFLLLLGGSLVWALGEVGLDGWALLPRLDVLLALGLFVWIAAPRRRPRPVRSPVAAALVPILAFAAGGAGLLAAGHLSAQADDAPVVPSVATVGMPEGEWHHIGRTAGADRFSPLGQITPANVDGLQVAWKVRLGMLPAGVIGALEGTPLMVGDTLYACNMRSEVFAIDGDSGAIRWRHDPKLDTKVVNMGICRGVTYFDAGGDGLCARRIIDTVYDGRLVALDARTGQPCPDFGKGGTVDLLEGLGPFDRGYYYLTSPATLVRDKLIVGGAVLDGQKVGQPSGVIRAYDARTGKFAWAWDVGRPGQTGMPDLGKGEAFTRGTPNAWPPMAGDDALNMVYVPLGNPTPDYVAAHRTPEMLKYGSSIVALDAGTGAEKWHFQTTHRDVWDYDNPASPTLVDFPTAGGTAPALIQPTKRGEFFVLDRRTGAPLVRTVEKPVPQGAVPGETLSPTQPYPVGMPSFSAPLTEAKMWGLTPFDHLWCRIRFRQARYDGDFTPIGTDRPSVIYPGYLGGSEWGGVSVDPGRKLMIVNVNHFPMYNRLVRSDTVDFKPMVVGEQMYDAARTPQKGTAYSAVITPFMSPLDVPCLQPPYSEIAAVDLATRKTVWRQPLGSARDSGPKGWALGLPLPMGVPAVGGSMVTASGLTFIAATQERSFRAFDSRTGRKLWEVRLPAGGHANPMSYRSPASGRQFVVIAASGHPLMADGNGDYLIAYALPKRGEAH